jgi:hypothetical protein
MKRLRAPKAKPGELKAQWGKLPHDGPDMCYAWGPGIGSCDAHLLHNLLNRQPLEHDYESRDRFPYKYGKSFMDELKERGYDITTLKFYVRKLAAPAPNPSHHQDEHP